MPFKTRVFDGTVSFKSSPTIISHNFIIANYGAGFAVDTDDGSSFVHIAHNVLYDGGAMKMDYGGCSSRFEHNFIFARPHTGEQPCYVVGAFLPGSADIMQKNKCVVPYFPPRNIHGHVGDNYQCTLPDINATYVFRPDYNDYYCMYEPLFGCQTSSGAVKNLTFTELQQAGVSTHSRHFQYIPTASEMLRWSRHILQM